MRLLGLSLLSMLFIMSPAFAGDKSPASPHHGGTHIEDSHAGDHGDGGLPQFDPSTFSSQVFWLLIAFAILYLFFANKTLPDISSVITNRQGHIRSDLETAENLRNQAHEVQESYEKGLEQARTKAQMAIEEAEKNLRSKAAADYEAFLKKSESEIKQAEASVIAAKEQVMQDINSVAADIATEATEKIIGVSADKQQAQNLVNSLTQKQKAA